MENFETFEMSQKISAENISCRNKIQKKLADNILIVETLDKNITFLSRVLFLKNMRARMS